MFLSCFDIRIIVAFVKTCVLYNKQFVRKIILCAPKQLFVCLRKAKAPQATLFKSTCTRLVPNSCSEYNSRQSVSQILYSAHFQHDSKVKFGHIPEQNSLKTDHAHRTRIVHKTKNVSVPEIKFRALITQLRREMDFEFFVVVVTIII